MKIAFISDIHGNATALDAVLEDINSRKVDKTIVLGDIAFRGPEPKRSIQLVQSLNTTVIKGNADEWVVRGINKGEVPDPAYETMSRERDWTISQLNQSDLDYLANLPTETTLNQAGITLHAFHATPTSLFDVILPDTDDETITSSLMIKNADIYLYAHIHKPYIRYINGKTVINLGSVGLPFDGQPQASYAIVEIQSESFTTSIQRVRYDFEKTIHLYKQLDYPNVDLMEKVIRNGSM